MLIHPRSNTLVIAIIVVVSASSAVFHNCVAQTPTSDLPGRSLSPDEMLAIEGHIHGSCPCSGVTGHFCSHAESCTACRTNGSLSCADAAVQGTGHVYFWCDCDPCEEVKECSLIEHVLCFQERDCDYLFEPNMRCDVVFNRCLEFAPGYYCEECYLGSVLAQYYYANEKCG